MNNKYINMTPINVTDDNSNIDYNPEMTALHARLDKLEQEIEWTHDMLKIIQGHIEDMRDGGSTHL